MGSVSRSCLPAAAITLVIATSATAQEGILPLRDVRPGMVGVGRTVFSGAQIDDFKAEVLGVLENVGPKQSIILARLSGGPISKTGVMQGMSGSPVFVNGKLMGAVALAFPFATEPIAGIRPIEEMLATPAPGPAAGAGNGARQVARADRENGEVAAHRLRDIATPFSLGGFSRATVDQFSPQLRQYGLEPMQGALGGGASAATGPMGDASKLRPGSMISVQLMTGDMSASADGTVTHIDGERIYAFGHQFLASGSTAMPFARAEVLTLLPNLSTSFKISTAKELMGVITQDRNVAITGLTGRRAQMTPIRIALRDSSGKQQQYSMEMVRERTLAPLLLQMAIHSVITGAERSFGPGTITIRGRMEFEGGLAPVNLDNTFSSDAMVSMLAAAYTSAPLSYVLQSGLDSLTPKLVDISIEATEQKRTLQVDQLWTTAREVRTGETLETLVSLTGVNGLELTRKVAFPVPVGTPSGPIYITIADAPTANLMELQPTFSSKARTVGQLAATLSKLRPNTRLTMRIWRSEPSYPVPGSELPSPPASVTLQMSKGQSPALAAARGATLAEFEIDLGGNVASGSKTIAVEVKD